MTITKNIITKEILKSPLLYVVLEEDGRIISHQKQRTNVKQNQKQKVFVVIISSLCESFSHLLILFHFHFFFQQSDLALLINMRI